MGHDLGTSLGEDSGWGRSQPSTRPMPPSTPARIVDHAHNDWLEWASEGGLPFAAVWAVLALATLRPAIRTVWGLGVPAIFLHAMVDYPFARFGLTAWIFILIGALGSADKREVRSGTLDEFQNGTVLIGGGDGVESKLRHGSAPGDRNCSRERFISPGQLDCDGECHFV